MVKDGKKIHAGYKSKPCEVQPAYASYKMHATIVT